MMIEIKYPMKRTLLLGLLWMCALSILLAGCTSNRTESQGEVKSLSVTADRMLNPIVPPGVYIADPEVRQMPDGEEYIGKMEI